MYKILLAGCLAFFHLIAKSQEAIGFSFNYGDIAIHTPAIEPLIKGPVYGFSINYAFANNKGAEWRKYYNFADYGINYNFINFNNPGQLGTAHSVKVFLQLPFVRAGDLFDFGFKGLTGLGAFTKKYDVHNNTINQAISSTLNINAEIRLYSRINFYPMFLEYSYGLNHFSNGLIKAPNLGINTFSNNFSMGYYIEEKVPSKETRKHQTERTESYEIWAASSLGIKEIEYDSKKYFYSGFTANFAVYLSRINKLGIGIDFLNDPSMMLMASMKNYDPGDTNINFRYGINLNHELLFGKTGFLAGYGIYLRDYGLYPTRRYYKAGFKYYYKNLIGMVILRALPLFRADVVEFGIGYKFTKYKRANRLK